MLPSLPCPWSSEQLACGRQFKVQKFISLHGMGENSWFEFFSSSWNIHLGGGAELSSEPESLLIDGWKGSRSGLWLMSERCCSAPASTRTGLSTLLLFYSFYPFYSVFLSYLFYSFYTTPSTQEDQTWTLAEWKILNITGLSTDTNTGYTLDTYATGTHHLQCRENGPTDRTRVKCLSMPE